MTILLPLYSYSFVRLPYISAIINLAVISAPVPDTNLTAKLTKYYNPLVITFSSSTKLSGLSNTEIKKYKLGYKERFIEELVEAIDHCDSFTLIGMPSIGKTDLFQTFDKGKDFWIKLYPKKEIDFQIIYVDLKKLLEVSPLGFYKLLVNRLYKSLLENLTKDQAETIRELYKETIASSDIFNIFSIVEDMIKVATEEANLKLCFLIDDFSDIIDFNKQFFNSLKALRNLDKYKILLVLSTDRDLTHTLSPEVVDDLWDLFLNKQILIKPLNIAEAKIAMDDWMINRNFDVPPKARNLIFEIGGGHLGYMKVLNQVYHDNEKDDSIFTEKNVLNLALNPKIKARSDKIWFKMPDQYKSFILSFLQNPKVQFDTIGKFLETLGVFKTKGSIKTLFSPLLEHYIKVEVMRVKEKEPIVSSGLYIEPKTKTIYVDGTQLDKEPTTNEFKILCLLYKNKGNLVSREELAEVIWGPNSIDKYSDWAIDRTISRIRKKLGDKSKNSRFIETVKGRGLKLIG